MSVSWPQVLLGGLSGVLLTFALARGLDISRNRPNLSVQLGETRERLYVRNLGEGGATDLIVCDPDDPLAQLVITLDILCVNHSFQPDALIRARLTAPSVEWRMPVSGRIRLDEAFTGVNVAPHSVTPVRLRFFVSKVAGAAQAGFGHIPVWSEDSLPDLVLAVTTVRQRRGLFPSRSTRELPVEAGDVRRSHREGVGKLEIHYLTKPPPGGPPASRRVSLLPNLRTGGSSRERP
ncbi:hypothetical protein ACI8AK_05310 [Geodermatophilus sp. SYSU D00867]